KTSSSTPNKKSGMAWEITEKPLARLLNQRSLRYQAISTPSTEPSTKLMLSENRLRNKVQGKACRITWLTGIRRVIEVPRLPRSRVPTYKRNCFQIGTVGS